MVKLDRENLLHHIHDVEEQFKMRQIIDKIEIVLRLHREEMTDFLNPHEVHLAESILNRFIDLNYSVFGGYEGAEQKIIYIYPSYMKEPEIEIEVFRFETLNNIKHPDILGSLLGLGIERKKIGDILIGKKYTYFFVKKEIANFIQFNFNSIGKYKVVVQSVSKLEELPTIGYREKKVIISSLRLDTFIAQSLNMSRKNSLELIQGEKVKVNFAKEVKPARELEEGDLISVRKYGRILFYKIENTTKKNNYVVCIKTPN